MIAKIRALLKRPGMRYLIIGSSVYGFELVVIVVVQRLGGSAVRAVATSFWLGLVLSFSLQKLVTFGDRRMHHKVLLPQVIAYLLLVAVNFTFTVVVAKLLISTVPAALSRTIALAITTLWNFYLYKTRIFKQAAEENTVY